MIKALAKLTDAVSKDLGKNYTVTGKLHEAKPSAISTVVSAICTLIHVITINRHNLPSLSPSGHYYTVKVDMLFQVNSCYFK